MLIVGYCYGIRFERRLCEEVELHLAYGWFCRLDLNNKVPDHSTFSVNRHGRFRGSDLLRYVFEAVVRACMDAGLVEGDDFAVDASVIERTRAAYTATLPRRSTGRHQNAPFSDLPDLSFLGRYHTSGHQTRLIQASRVMSTA